MDHADYGGSAAIKNEIQRRLIARHAIGEQSVHLLDATTWEEQLVERQKFARPGERLLFDMLSADHVRAYARAARSEHQLTGVHAEEFVEALERHGMQITALVPYGGVSNAIAPTLWLTGSLAAGFTWERVISWVTRDPGLFELLIYIEEEILGTLTSEVAGSFVAVVDNRADREANAAWIARDRAFKRTLRAGFSEKSVAPFVGKERWGQWSSALARLLEHAPNRIAFFRLLDAAHQFGYPFDVEGLAGARWAPELLNLIRQRRIDGAVWTYVENLLKDPEIALLLTARNGFASGMEADLIPRLTSLALGVAGDE